MSFIHWTILLSTMRRNGLPELILHFFYAKPSSCGPLDKNKQFQKFSPKSQVSYYLSVQQSGMVLEVEAEELM